MRRLALHFLLVLIAFLLFSPRLSASALGQLQHMAGSSGSVPAVPEPQAVDPMTYHTDPNATGAVWTLHCDCSTCPRNWYPDPHPSKGPYSSQSACETDLRQVQNRAGAAACERCYCEQSGGGGGGGGGGGLESSTQDALRAAQELGKRGQGDSGKDLLSQEKSEEADNARYGVGRDKNGFRKLGDGPLQVLILKLEGWCGRSAPEGGGAAARDKAREDAAKIADLVAKTRERMDTAEAPFQQRQRALRMIDCAEKLQDQLLAFGRPKAKTPTPGPKATSAGDWIGGTPQLLRKDEDLGHPYINCATWKKDVATLRAGLPHQWDTIKRTQKMLDSAGRGAAEAWDKGHEQASAFAKDEIKGAVTDYLGKIKAADRTLNLAMRKAGLGPHERKMMKDLQDQLEKTKKRAEEMQAAGEEWQRFNAAGGVRAYMKGYAEQAEAYASAVLKDPETREAVLAQGGEALAGLGGPAGAFGFRALKTDIDLTALAVEQGIDEKEAAQHRETLRILKDQLSNTEEGIKFLEQEGKAQCP